MRTVHVAGVGMTRFAKQSDETLKTLTGAAVRDAVADAGLQLADLEAAYFGNAVGGLIDGQEMIRGQVALRPLGIDEIPIFNIENACASGSSAFHLAWQAVASGACEIVLAVGAEKMSHPDKQRTFDALASAIDVAAVAAGSEDTFPRSEAGRSAFMDLYAQEARAYMAASGAEQADFARVAVKNQHNGALNPRAQYGAELSVDEVLASREIVYPLTLLMCSPVSDGAAAAVLVSEEVARRLGPAGRPPVRVAASVVRSGLGKRGSSAAVAAAKAYELAGIGPEDVSCAELHDASASAELELIEALGLAAPGGAVGLVRDGATSIGGRIPVNTSGGLLAKGHPVGATGIAQLCEATWQLRGEAGGRQVAGARVALTQNAGGWLFGDNAVAAVTLLSR